MRDIFRRFIGQMADQYATVLLVLGAVATITYMILITDIRNQEGNARLVKMSTEQGQLVGDINLLLTEKTYLTDAEVIRRVDGKIISNLTLLDQNHASLSAGDRYIREGERLVHVPGNLSQELRIIYFDNAKPLDQQMRTYLSTARDLYRRSANHLTPGDPELSKLLFTLSPHLQEEISKASSLYQRQSEFMLGTTVNKQHMMFAISLATLLLVGTLLLQPLVLKLKENALKIQQEKAFADNVINTTQALIIGLDANGQVVLFNQYAEENSGWSEEEVKGNDFFSQFIPEHNQAELRKLFTDMMSGELQYADAIETLMRISTGDLLNIVWNPTVITDPATSTPLMFLATGLDITERKEAEQQVKQANAELAQLSSRLQGEVNLAATLQRSILPQPVISLPGIQGLANLLTSSEVGGDYYDYYKVGGHHSILFIGDVSGHGVAAGTMVGAAKAGVYPLIHEGYTNPGEILNSLNINMQATAQQSLLMTMACLSLDASNGRLVFANAGHVLPYLLRKDAQYWEMLEASGLPLGKSLDSDYLHSAIELTLNVGDKLFLYTDGLVEEESPSGEAFGYDRLEFLLNANIDVENPEDLRNILMDALRVHCRGTAYTDDITIVVFSHTDRVIQASQNNDVSDIIRISEGFYRQGEHPIPRISKEYVVFLAEQGYSDLLTRFSQDGICRILPKNDDFCQKLGWEHLLNQHHESADDDLYALMPGQPQYRQFQLTHTEDKAFITEEIFSWLNDQGTLPKDHIEALMVILDEMTENSLYAAPRDGKGIAYYEKGESRELDAHEEVRIDIAVADGLLGLMITDNWGTLTPGVFLKNIAHAMENGVEAGIGGVGLYMMWRLSDYLQIRVHPQKRTQVTTLWDINNPIDMDVDSGIQFIYHTEYEAAYPVGA
ncbi:MAG: SpoIIE family protein phosphatase [Methylovulum sp.]|uniref:SpoIIE family protein phosphatase n=1 Tax=Methylovulum sp. TaxID=1916980 RepID=UPI002623A1BF|nr:SpoIIE family protein phosphatase [Methylovulum sp.]MDD2725613.1 SpoIIE family protein phosphatase [Methylovulum sp.]MDD5125865.1 SpoIIE family protein phosphatase [Methylovulum sp.]